jgi:hypothetical protein
VLLVLLFFVCLSWLAGRVVGLSLLADTTPGLLLEAALQLLFNTLTTVAVVVLYFRLRFLKEDLTATQLASRLW